MERSSETGTSFRLVVPQRVQFHSAVVAATGIAGLSIEDSTGDPLDPLHEFDLAVDRVRAARRAIDESGTGIVLTGRSEGFVVGRPDIDETIRRLRAYAEAGADCLYAPRIDDVDHIAAIVAAVAPKPVNLLINAIWLLVGGGFYWPVFPLLGWGIGVAFHIWDVYAPENPSEDRIQREMDKLKGAP